MRVQSESACESGGWFHFDNLLERPASTHYSPPVPQADAPSLARGCYLDRDAAGARCELAEILGVSEEALDQLGVGVGRDPSGSSWWSFPSRDADGKVVGIIRRYRNGSKLTYPGTSNGGVFCSRQWWKTSGVIMIVEGGSDVAAALSHGVCAVGRPSNVGGVGVLREMLNRHARGRPVIVIGENDEKPYKRGSSLSPWCPAHCTCCPHCYPGKFGAEHVAKQLGVSFCMPPFPFKDFREASNSVVWLDLLRAIETFSATA